MLALGSQRAGVEHALCLISSLNNTMEISSPEIRPFGRVPALSDAFTSLALGLSATFMSVMPLRQRSNKKVHIQAGTSLRLITVNTF